MLMVRFVGAFVEPWISRGTAPVVAYEEVSASSLNQKTVVR